MHALIGVYIRTTPSRNKLREAPKRSTRLLVNRQKINGAKRLLHTRGGEAVRKPRDKILNDVGNVGRGPRRSYQLAVQQRGPIDAPNIVPEAIFLAASHHRGNRPAEDSVALGAQADLHNLAGRGGPPVGLGDREAGLAHLIVCMQANVQRAGRKGADNTVDLEHGRVRPEGSAARGSAALNSAARGLIGSVRSD